MAVEILQPGAPLAEKFNAAVASIFQVLNQQPQGSPLVVALCGGRSVVGLLQVFLRQAVHQPSEILKRLQFFMVDERIVPITHPDSNFGGLAQQLFNSLIEQGVIKATQLHPLTITGDDVHDACAGYLQELEASGGKFTVVVVGMGEDGHIAGLFPHHPALSSSAKAFIPFFDSPKPPAARVTASRELVTGASLGVLLALGEAKRQAWQMLNSDTSSIEECPAKMVASIPRCVVVSDLES
ncbi:MAG: 6-phosphogluconolactonase [Pseudomonadota bacterium]|jgi:6-phosphogluconolactonase